jgi:hypothetical protein
MRVEVPRQSVVPSGNEAAVQVAKSPRRFWNAVSMPGPGITEKGTNRRRLGSPRKAGSPPKCLELREQRRGKSKRFGEMTQPAERGAEEGVDPCQKDLGLRVD